MTIYQHLYVTFLPSISEIEGKRKVMKDKKDYGVYDKSSLEQHFCK